MDNYRKIYVERIKAFLGEHQLGARLYRASAPLAALASWPAPGSLPYQPGIAIVFVSHSHAVRHPQTVCRSPRRSPLMRLRRSSSATALRRLGRRIGYVEPL